MVVESGEQDVNSKNEAFPTWNTYIPASLATYLLKWSKFCNYWVFASKKVNKFLSKNEIWKCIDELTYILVKRYLSIRNSKKSEKPTLPKVYSSIFGNFFVEMCHKILVILFWGEQSHDLRVYVSMITKNGSQIDSVKKERNSVIEQIKSQAVSKVHVF